MEAFELALSHGCDGFEFDVRLSRDGVPLVGHDASPGGLEIARATLDRIRQNRRLATLSEVMASFAERAFVSLEIKVAGAEDSILSVLEQYPPASGCVISSFIPTALEALHTRSVQWSLGLVCETNRQYSRWRDLPVEVLMLERSLVSGAVVDELHAAGKRVFVWTVNSEREMRQFAQLHVDGIISDDTLLLSRTLRGTDA